MELKDISKTGVFTIDPLDKVTEQTVGAHALNPFVVHNSSPRSYMYTSHLSQIVVLRNGKEKIVQSGLDHQFGDCTFSVKIEEDCFFVDSIEKYSSYDKSKNPSEIIIFVETVSGKYDYYIIPYYFSLHQYFGFEYKYDIETIRSFKRGQFLPKGTILADSPAVKKNSGYAYGVNGNIALIGLPSTAEDGVVISESFAKELTCEIFETRTLKFGSNKFLLNIYGDDENYKGFPSIGEMINEDGLLAVLRSNDETLTPALTSKDDLKNYDPTFDHCIYMSEGGKVIDINGEKVKSGVVVDISFYNNPKAKQKNNVYPYTLGETTELVDDFKNYYKSIIDVYEERMKKNSKSNNKRKDGTINLSERLSKLISEAFTISDRYDQKIPLTHRQVPLDVFHGEFTIKYVVVPTVGNKITDSNGAKGVIVSVLPDEEMPYDKNGVRADIIMDPTSAISRMNLGRLYEIYFNMASRTARDIIRVYLGTSNNGAWTTGEWSKEKVEGAWDIVLEFLSYFETEQLETYSKATYEQKLEVLEEIVTSEFYLLYRVSSSKPAYYIVLELEKSRFKPLRDNVYIPQGDTTYMTLTSMSIGPLYTILLSKTADESIAGTTSPKNNHFGFPASLSSVHKHRLPFKEKGNKFLSETEVRSYRAYGGSWLIAELKDRANSGQTQKFMYKRILDADKPGYIDDLTPRDEIKFGKDSALLVLDRILLPAGIKIEYVEDEESVIPEKLRKINRRELGHGKK